MFEDSPVFLAGLMLRAERGVSYAIGVSGRGKSSFKMECLQVGRVWDFFFPLMQILLIIVFMFWPIPSGALTTWQFRGTPTWHKPFSSLA